MKTKSKIKKPTLKEKLQESATYLEEHNHRANAGLAKRKLSIEGRTQ